MDLLILLAGDLIFPLKIVLVFPDFSSTNFSNFSHFDTKILGVAGVEISFLEEDLSLRVFSCRSWKLEVVLARLDTVDLSPEDRKDEVLES